MVEELPVELGSLPSPGLGVDEHKERLTVGLRGDLEGPGADVETGVGALDDLVPALLPHHGPLPVEDGGADGGGREDVGPVGAEPAVRGDLTGAPVV